MKHLTLLFTALLITTCIFAKNNKRIIHNHKINSTTTLQCTQKATVTSTGSYTCDGIPYSVSVSATASASSEDCGTASAEASGTAYLLSASALQTSLQALQSSCSGVE